MKHLYKSNRSFFNLMVMVLIVSSWTISGCGGFGQEYKVGLFPIKKGGMYGYINRDGEQMISAQFAYGTEFSEGIAGVNIGGTTSGYDMPEDGRWGFINRSGEIIINPKYYSPPNGFIPYTAGNFARAMHEAYVFSEGFAAVRTEKEWVYIDTLDQVRIENPRFQSVRRFVNGLANVCIDGKWGYINKAGEIVIEPQYIYPANFDKKYLLLMDQKLRRVMIDRNGNRVLPQYRIESNFYEGVAAVKAKFHGEKITASDELKYGLVDTAGREIVSPQFDAVGRFGSGMCPVLVGSKPQTMIAYPDHLQPSGYVGGKWGFIDHNGHFVINPTFEGAQGYSEGVAAIKSGGLWGFMNEGGTRITDYEFRWVGYFRDGLAPVVLGPAHNDYDGQTAYIDTNGDVVWIEDYY